MTAVRFGHWSGKFNGSSAALADFIAELMADLDWLTTTESQRHGIAGVVRKRLGPDFRVQKCGEFMLISRRATCTPWGRQPLPRWAFVTKVLGLVGWRQMHVPRFALRVNGTPVAIWPFHAPSAVQAEDGFRYDHPRIVAASKAGFARLGRRMRHFERSHPQAFQVTAGDSNYDQHREVWRDRLTAWLGAPSAWTGHLPRGGSHGVRLIDTAHVVGLTITSAHVNRGKPKGFDHDAVLFVANPTTRKKG